MLPMAGGRSGPAKAATGYPPVPFAALQAMIDVQRAHCEAAVATREHGERGKQREGVAASREGDR